METCKLLWYAVQKKNGDYWIGQMFAREDIEEIEAIEGMKEFCDRKKYRLVLLIHIPAGLPIINQLYPYEMTDEARACLPQVVDKAQSWRNDL